MGLMERIKEAELQKQQREQFGKIKLDKEYKFKLNDGKVHEFVPVNTYDNGKYVGVIVDGNRYAVMPAAKFEQLIDKNQSLNKDIDERTSRTVKELEQKQSHDQTQNKQEREEKKASAPKRSENMVYSTITIYDTADDGDRYMSVSVPVMMDSRGNIFNTNGKTFSRASEELDLDVKNDTSIFYEDWMHARGEAITPEDKLADGENPEVAYETGRNPIVNEDILHEQEEDIEQMEQQPAAGGLKGMRESVSKEEFKFTTKNYTDKEIEEAMEEMDITTRDKRWDC